MTARPPYMPAHDELVRKLRTWLNEGQDPHRVAAVELLISHNHWLHVDGLVDACVRLQPDLAWVDFRELAHYLDGDSFGTATASTTELAILRLAVALALDEFKLARMDADNSERIARAVSTALGGVQIHP